MSEGPIKGPTVLVERKNAQIWALVEYSFFLTIRTACGCMRISPWPLENAAKALVLLEYAKGLR